jgi:hypothetical protein
MFFIVCSNTERGEKNNKGDIHYAQAIYRIFRHNN